MNFQQATFLASYGTFSQLPPCKGMEIAFAGRSNVGKSTMLNKIFNRKALARVSAVPGKTATINFYQIPPVTFVDLPGYGYAKVAKTEKRRWAELIDGYLESDRDIRLTFLLLDMRHAPSKDDLQMIEYLIAQEMPFVIVLTKADKLKKSQLAKTQEEFETLCRPYGCQKVVLTSGENGYGIPELQAVLNEAVAAEFTDDEEAE